ncbi:MAG: TonB-dependent receptor plug domain-containing protein [Kofleriaceae bacterium]
MPRWLVISVVIAAARVAVAQSSGADDAIGTSSDDAIGTSSDEADAEVIEISGKAPEESTPLVYTMSAQDIASTPGAMNDALRGITILPAAARIPFSFGGVVLRGMSPRDSSVFIDGVEIPIPYHFGGITGVFPTQALDDMRVVPSGFDVSIGRTQGGVVELTTRKPRGDAYRVGGEASLLHSLVTAEGPVWGDGAFLVTLRRSYFDVLARPFVDRVDPNIPLPSYSDGQLRAVWGEPGGRGQLSTYVIGSLDRLTNSEKAASPNPGDNGYVAANLGFVRAGAIYKRTRGPSLFTVAPMVGSNVLTVFKKDYAEGSMTPTTVDVSRRWYLYGVRGEWLHDDASGFVRAGLDVTGGYLGRVPQHSDSDIPEDLPLPRNTVVWSDAAAFIERRHKWLGDKISVRGGLRLDRFGLGNQWAVDPRVNAHVTLSSSATLRASLGRFHQPPSPAHFDELADNMDARSSYVDQASLGVELQPETGVLAAVTGFFHDGKRTLVDIADKNVRPNGIDLQRIYKELLEEQLGLYSYQANVGRQRSYGIEAALRIDRPRYRAMANFSWSRAKRMHEPAAGSSWVPYELDQPLRLNVLASTRVARWDIGTRLTVASGNPVNVIAEGVMPVDGMEPAPQLQRLPTFWQLDVRVAHVAEVHDQRDAVLRHPKRDEPPQRRIPPELLRRRWRGSLLGHQGAADHSLCWRRNYTALRSCRSCGSR